MAEPFFKLCLRHSLAEAVLRCVLRWWREKVGILFFFCPILPKSNLVSAKWFEFEAVGKLDNFACQFVQLLRFLNLL